MANKENIVAAAIVVFSEKGKHGASMDEIAKHAKANKAMLYYYFSNKDNLYREALHVVMRDLHATIASRYRGTAQRTADPVTNLSQLAIAHMEAFCEHPNYVALFHEAIVNQPELVNQLMMETHVASGDECPMMHTLQRMLQAGVDDGTFRAVDVKQVLISIIGMNLIFFIGKPIGKAMLNLSVDDEKAFLEERKKSIIDLLLHGLLKTEEIVS